MSLPKFYSYLKEGTSAPLVEERYTGNPWVYFGADNLFLENMSENCPHFLDTDESDTLATLAGYVVTT